MAGITWNGCEWLEMARNGCKLMGLAGNGWNGLKWLEIAGNGPKPLEMARTS